MSNGFKLRFQGWKSSLVPVEPICVNGNELQNSNDPLRTNETNRMNRVVLNGSRVCTVRISSILEMSEIINFTGVWPTDSKFSPKVCAIPYRYV